MTDVFEAGLDGIIVIDTAGFLERTSAPRVSKPYSSKDLARALLEASA